MVQYSRRKMQQYDMVQAAGNMKFPAEISETKDCMACWINDE